MNRMFFRHLTGVLGAVTLAGSAGGLVALLAFGGSGLTSTQAATALGGPAAAVGAASPSPGALSAPATQVTEGPPPVVDGVQRTNVGSDHSPQIQQQLSGPPPTAPPPIDAGALGVDVADRQHPHGAAIDWSQVAAAGYKFAFIKATEGDYYVNPYYASDLAQAEAAGMDATGYHFAIPNVSGGASQADYAAQNSSYTAEGRTLPPALDIEYNPVRPGESTSYTRSSRSGRSLRRWTITSVMTGTVCRPAAAMSRINPQLRLRGESGPAGHATVKESPR